jgi:hypothetical protein
MDGGIGRQVEEVCTFEEERSDVLDLKPNAMKCRRVSPLMAVW